MAEIEILEWKDADSKRKLEIMQRSQLSLEEIGPKVKSYIQLVREKGDQGIIEYLRQFDRFEGMIGKFSEDDFTPSKFRISVEDIKESYNRIPKNLFSKIREQIALSKKFHLAALESIPKGFEIEQVPGVWAGYKRLPVDSVGLYVPAGKAPLPTVAQVLTVAAKCAGVPRIVVCFPPTNEEAEDAIIVAAVEAGADELYRVGGVAAIAALAYGTETIRPVQKIAGPGNPWVQSAKLQVVNRVGIDMFSGPSEAAILADESSNPKFLAADILARCEHGPDSAGVLITTSRSIAETTQSEVERQKKSLTRQDYINESLARFSAIIIVDSLEEMIAITNEYKPEHLEIQTKNPEEIFKRIRHAGSTFLGNFAPVAVGDYASGTNHCLPTGTATAYSSPVNPEGFMKILQYQRLTKDGLRELMPIVETISDVEGLDAHKRSVQIRFED